MDTIKKKKDPWDLGHHMIGREILCDRSQGLLGLY